MKFCPKCGCVLIEKDSNISCPRCDHKEKGEIKIQSSEKIKTKQEVIVKDEEETEVHPIADAKCPKCDHNQAYFWTIQTRAGDEAPTRFFKCTKCKHTWREYR